MLNPTIHAYITVPTKLPAAVVHEIAGAVKLACLHTPPRVMKEETIQPHLIADLVCQDIAIILRVPIRTKKLLGGYTLEWTAKVGTKIEEEVTRILLAHKLALRAHLETDIVMAKIPPRYF